jgi:uncharacterized protein
MGRTVWIDLENSPHVLFFRPWIEWLRADGHQVLLTARDLSQTHELLRLHGLEFLPVGGHGGGSSTRKALRVLARAAVLARSVRGRRVALAMGHGSRAQVIAAWLLRVPSVTFLDYEFVSLGVFGGFSRRVFFPEAVDAAVLGERGIPAGKLVRYPGFKEQIYLDPARDHPMPQSPPLILVRPPARRAHYHTPKSEQLYTALVARLTREASGAQVLFLPRYTEDRAELERLAAAHAHVVVSSGAESGRELLLRATLVVSGGGTMVREAAVLGVPAASFFGGPLGGVDAELERLGRLQMLRSEEDVARLALPGTAGWTQARGAGRETAPLPDTQELRRFLWEKIESLLRS